MIEKEIESVFLISKLKDDFHKWLFENYSNRKKIEINEIDDLENVRTISISKTELFEMFKVIVEYDKYRGLWYTVYIAIGEFTKPDESGIMKVEKAITKLFYNSDLSFYDAELYFDSMND